MRRARRKRSMRRSASRRKRRTSRGREGTSGCRRKRGKGTGPSFRGGVRLRSKGRPPALPTLALDLPDLRLGDAEALRHQLAGLRNAHLLVLGLHQRAEDLLPALLREVVGRVVTGHGFLSWGWFRPAGGIPTSIPLL